MCFLTNVPAYTIITDCGLNTTPMENVAFPAPRLLDMDLERGLSYAPFREITAVELLVRCLVPASRFGNAALVAKARDTVNVGSLAIFFETRLVIPVSWF